MNLKDIEKLINLFEKSTLGSMEIEENGLKVKLNKNSKPEIIDYTEAKQETKKEIVSGNFVSSPLVGTYHDSQYSGAQSFVKVGDIVKKGDKLCVIEAMKVMNEIKSPYDGKILEIYYNDGDMVEYGSNLFKIGD